MRRVFLFCLIRREKITQGNGFFVCCYDTMEKCPNHEKQMNFL